MATENPANIDKVFKALGHVTRRRILQLLAQHPRYPYELSKLLDLNRRVVLKHLDALQEAGLVERETGESEGISKAQGPENSGKTQPGAECKSHRALER